MEREHYVIQYVRKKDGRPLGAIVAVKGEHGFRIGYSLCSRKDRFKKETGLKIAFGRADTWSVIPRDTPKEILAVLPAFIARCKRYYRTENEPAMESAPF